MKPSAVFEFCLFLYYVRRSDTALWKCGINFSCVITKVYKIRKVHKTIFSIVYNVFSDKKLRNLTKLIMFFLAVLINFRNSVVYLIGIWFIYESS